ncbi:hypothetical protein LOAG_09677, partial [Loa loa]
MIEDRIGPLDLSAPERPVGKNKCKNKTEEIMARVVSKGTSRLEEHTNQDDAKSLNLPIQKASEKQTRIGRKRKISRENTTHT